MSLDDAPATKADIRRLIEYVSGSANSLYAAGERRKNEILQHFDATAMRIRRDLQQKILTKSDPSTTRTTSDVREG